MIKDYLIYIAKKYNIEKYITVKTNKKNVSKIIGNKKSNSTYMKNKLKINLKTKEEDIDINDLEIVLDDNKSIKINMNDIYSSLYNIYNL